MKRPQALPLTLLAAAKPKGKLMTSATKVATNAVCNVSMVASTTGAATERSRFAIFPTDQRNPLAHLASRPRSPFVRQKPIEDRSCKKSFQNADQATTTTTIKENSA